MDKLGSILKYLSLLLLVIYLGGLFLGPNHCVWLVYIVIGIPWSTVLVYFGYFLKRRDLFPALGSILILVELGLLVYLREHFK